MPKPKTYVKFCRRSIAAMSVFIRSCALQRCTTFDNSDLPITLHCRRSTGKNDETHTNDGLRLLWRDLHSSLYAQIATMRRWFWCDGSQAGVVRLTAR
jgi:hypothetical protein